MIELELLKNIFIAIALGLMIGLEREYARYKKRTQDYAGIRTFPLIALFGALSAYLGDRLSPWILAMGMAIAALLIILAYFALARRTTTNFGATSEVAGFLTFFIGVLSYYGELKLAAILTIAITIILYARTLLHRFAERIKNTEITAMLMFAVMVFIILPFLPNRWYGPGELFNPFITWIMVVFISGISFVGYILMKWLREKGIALTGILGGLVSSTATTMSFAERSVKEKKVSRALALGVILANGVMFIRILVEVFVVNQQLFFALLLPLAILALITIVVSYFIWIKAKDIKGKLTLLSPFRLRPALKFALFFAAIIALTKIAHLHLAARGVYLVSFLSGFADVDAITLSLSQLAKGSLLLDTAKDGIIIAALTNVAVKGGIAWFFGGKEFRIIIISLFSALILMGLILLFLL